MTAASSATSRRPPQRFTFKGYAPKTSKAIEPLKKLIHYAATHKTNDGVQFKMSIAKMRELLAGNAKLNASTRTIAYALKRLVLEGYISRQTRWRSRPGQDPILGRTITRIKGRFLRELAGAAERCFKVLGLTWHHGGEGVVQKVAAGYMRYLSNVLPRAG